MRELDLTYVLYLYYKYVGTVNLIFEWPPDAHDVHVLYLEGTTLFRTIFRHVTFRYST